MQVGSVVKVHTKFHGWRRAIILDESEDMIQKLVLYEEAPKRWRRCWALPRDLRPLTFS